MQLKDINLHPVARWPYEQAFATDFALVFERDDEWQEIERLWAKDLGTYQDNKVTFKAVTEGGKEYYLTFHDNSVYIGTGIRPYRGGDLPEPQLRITQ